MVWSSLVSRASSAGTSNPSKHEGGLRAEARKRWRGGVEDNAMREYSASPRCQRRAAHAGFAPDHRQHPSTFAKLICDLVRNFGNRAAEQYDVVGGPGAVPLLRRLL